MCRMDGICNVSVKRWFAFLFDKKSDIKLLLGSNFFKLIYLKTFWKIFVLLEKYSTDFPTSGTKWKPGFFLVCRVPTPLVSSFFSLPYFLQTSCVERISTQIFDFGTFLENYPAIYEILGSMDRTACGKLPFVSGCALFFLHTN